MFSAQIWTRSPRDTLDRVERAAPHSDHDNIDFHTGQVERRANRVEVRRELRPQARIERCVVSISGESVQSTLRQEGLYHW